MCILKGCSRFVVSFDVQNGFFFVATSLIREVATMSSSV